MGLRHLNFSVARANVANTAATSQNRVTVCVSVMMQVGYFKLSGGKRIFKVAPIHHHFHLSGWTETQTVTRFWLVAAVFATFALATLKLR